MAWKHEAWAMMFTIMEPNVWKSHSGWIEQWTFVVFSNGEWIGMEREFYNNPFFSMYGPIVINDPILRLNLYKHNQLYSTKLECLRVKQTFWHVKNFFPHCFQSFCLGVVFNGTCKTEDLGLRNSNNGMALWLDCAFYLAWKTWKNFGNGTRIQAWKH